MLLLVSHDLELSQTLTSHGYLNLLCREEAAIRLCQKFPISGVAVDGREYPAICQTVCQRLRENEPKLPIALLLPNGILPNAPVDRLMREESPFEFVTAFCRENCAWQPLLRCYHLTVGVRPEETVLLGYPFPLSTTEHRLLRTLFHFAPRRLSLNDLLLICFPEGNRKAANISVQISNINRKAEPQLGYPLIENRYGFGYRISPFLFGEKGSRFLLN